MSNKELLNILDRNSKDDQGLSLQDIEKMESEFIQDQTANQALVDHIAKDQEDN